MSSAHVDIDIDISLAVSGSVYEVAVAALPTRLLTIAVLVDDLAFDLAFSCKAAALLFVLGTDADADIQALLDFFNDFVNVDGAATVVVVDDFLGAAVGCRLGRVDGNDVGVANVGLEALGRRVARVGDNVDHVRAGRGAGHSGGNSGRGGRGRLNALLDVRVGSVVRVLGGRWAVFAFVAVWTIVAAGVGGRARGLACVGRHGRC